MNNGPETLFPKLFELLNGYQVSQIIINCARLNLADHLEGGPGSLDDLAGLTGTNRDALYRLLRAAASLDLLVEAPKEMFRLTPLGELLKSTHSHSLTAAALFIGSPEVWSAWGSLDYSIYSGKTAFQHLYGLEFFEYNAANPQFGRIFDNWMTGFSQLQSGPLLANYDLSGFRKVVDIGGGNGRLLAAILQKYREMKGLLYDLPQVVAHAPELLESSGVADRCEVLAGSFFENVPGGYDLYLLKMIIHDWDDRRAALILSQCRSAMYDGARLLIIERVLPELVDHPVSLNSGFGPDINMLVLNPGGRERTAAEFQKLAQGCGLRLVRIVPTPVHLAFIELTTA